MHFQKSVCYEQLDNQWEKMVQIRGSNVESEISKATLKNSRNPTQIFSSSVPGRKQDLLFAAQCLDKEASIKFKTMSLL